MPVVAANLQTVRRRLAAAALEAGRSAGDVSLLAVSKTFPPGAVRAAFEAGQRAFGENYVQEGLDKIAALDYRIEMHRLRALFARIAEKGDSSAERYDGGTPDG